MGLLVQVIRTLAVHEVGCGACVYLLRRRSVTGRPMARTFCLATFLGASLVASLLSVPVASGHVNPHSRRATASLASKAIYWRSARNRPVDAVRPRLHSVLSDIRYRGLRWSRWGRSGAVGAGNFVWDCQIVAGNSCSPLIVPMTITLSGVKTCPDKRQIFGRANVQPQGARSAVLTYDCRGRSRSEGTK